MSKATIPILLAIDDGQQFRAWCPHCRRWHLHGRSEGHRVAHCDALGRAHYPAGYELRLVERLEEAMRHPGTLRRPTDRSGSAPEPPA